MRLVFLGSPPFALPVFDRVLTGPHDVRALVTQPDRRKGRGRKVQTSLLVELAGEHGVEVVQPETTKDPEFVARLRAFEPDVLLVASYGEILREDVLDMCPHGALNVHASLLPRWRGASPIQRAILEGDAETGVTIQRIVKKLDAGDVLHALSLTIDERDTSGSLLERLAALGAQAAAEALDQLSSGTATFTPQDEAAVTLAPKLTKDDGRIDWQATRAQIDRHVRAMTPWPGARTTLPDGREAVVIEVGLVDQTTPQGTAPGTLLSVEGSMIVAAGDGALEIRRLKPAGKQAMEGRAFLLGARLEAGSRLGD